MKRDRNKKEYEANMTIAQVWKARKAHKGLTKNGNQELKTKNKEAA